MLCGSFAVKQASSVSIALVFIFPCFVQCFQIMSRSLLGLYYSAGGWALCTFVGLTCACLCSEQVWESVCEKLVLGGAGIS